MLPPLCETERRVIPMRPLYSGGECDVNGFDAPAVVDIETLVIEEEPPALIEHDDNLKVGRLINIRKEQVGGQWQVVCDAEVHGTIYAKQLLDYIDADIHKPGPSIGISRGRQYNVKTIPGGQTAQINGRTFRGPIDILFYGHLTEGSFVSQRGDPEARCLLAAMKTFFKGENTMGFDAFLASKDITKEQFDAMSDEEKATLKAEFESLGSGEMDAALEDGSGGTGDSSGDATEALREAAVEVISEELANATPEEIGQIVSEITTEVDEMQPVLGASARVEKAKLLAKQKANALRASKSTPANPALAESRRVEGLKALQATHKSAYAGRIIANAIATGSSVDAVSKCLGKIEGTKPKTLQANMGFGISNPQNGIHKQDELLLRFARTMGWKDDEIAKYISFQTPGGATKVLNASIKGLNNTTSFQELVIESVNSMRPGTLNPYSRLAEAVPMMRKVSMASKMNYYGRNGKALEASLGFSTIYATDILYAIIAASLERAQDKVAPLYREITREEITKDFSAVEMYNTGLKGRLRAISETGQLSHLSFSTSKLQYQTDPLGATFAIPEMVLIQDQLGAFAQLVQELSQIPEESVENDVAMMWQAMMAGHIKDQDGTNPFFSAANNNVVGAGSKMNADGLRNAMNAAKKFKNDNGYPLSPQGSFALIPSALTTDAEELYTSMQLFYDGTGGDNMMRGKVPFKEWLWLNSEFTQDGQPWTSDYQAIADKAWVYMADPQKRPAVVVSKLAGYTSAQIKQYDMDPNVWGLQYQLIYPYGVTPMYTNGAILMQGQA